jgi:hypothetical protein
MSSHLQSGPGICMPFFPMVPAFSQSCTAPVERELKLWGIDDFKNKQA